MLGRISEDGKKAAEQASLVPKQAAGLRDVHSQGSCAQHLTRHEPLAGVLCSGGHAAVLVTPHLKIASEEQVRVQGR